MQSVWHADGEPEPQPRRMVAQFVFWTLAEYCHEFHLPFDLMIGVNRGVYAGGVHQGRDLYDSRVSLIQYQATVQRLSARSRFRSRFWPASPIRS